MENVNRGVEDNYYRYKMPKLLAKVEGNGNGIKTVIPNMKEIAKALGRSPEYPTKFFGFELGSQTIMDEKNSRYIVNGSHEQKKLADLLDVYIKKFILCGHCSNPETEMILKSKKGSKDKDLYLSCKACGKLTQVDPIHKLTGFIVKNPPPNLVAKKTDKKEKEPGSKKPGEEGDEKEDVPEEIADSLAKSTLSSAEDPAELFANFISEAERTSDELLFEANKYDLNTELASAIVVQVLLEGNVVPNFKKHHTLIKDFVKGDEKGQKGILGGLERLVCVTHPDLLPKIPQIIKLFYDDEILQEEIIFAWHEKVKSKFAGDKELAKKVREAAQPLIDWLKNAEEESDED